MSSEIIKLKIKHYEALLSELQSNRWTAQLVNGKGHVMTVSNPIVDLVVDSKISEIELEITLLNEKLL